MFKLGMLRWECNLRLSRRFDICTKVLTRRQEGQGQKRETWWWNQKSEREIWKYYAAGPEDGGKDHEPWNARWPLPFTFHGGRCFFITAADKYDIRGCVAHFTTCQPHQGTLSLKILRTYIWATCPWKTQMEIVSVINSQPMCHFFCKLTPNLQKAIDNNRK